MTERTFLVTCKQCQLHFRLPYNVPKYVCPTCTAKNIKRFEEKKNQSNSNPAIQP